jgi:hypothetical protein
MSSMSAHYIIQKTLITNKCTKSFFINCNTLLHVSTLLGHLQGELSVVVTLRLHFIVELFTVYCVAFGGAKSVWFRLECTALLLEARNLACTASRDHRDFVPPNATQYTVNSSTIKCNRSVTTTESSPWRWPSRVETCRSVLQLMKKLFVHLLVINVFFCYFLFFIFSANSRLTITFWYSLCHVTARNTSHRDA